MKVMIMRHTLAMTRAEAKVAYDAERPLAPGGRDHARRLGHLFRHLGCIPSPVVCSPFVRTLETANIVCQELGGGVEPVAMSILAPGSSTDELLRAAASYHRGQKGWMLAVMHEPDVSYILGSLLYEGKSFPLEVRQGDLFALDLQVNHGQRRASLVFAVSPSQLFGDTVPAVPAAV